MIPNFPDLKDEFNRALSRFMQRRIDFHLGVVGSVPRGRVFEGKRHVMVRENGSEEETEMREASVETRIPIDEIRGLDLPHLLEKIDASAKEMARIQATGFYQSMAKGVAKIGNTVDAGGKPLTVELFLDALEKILIDFYSDGSPHMPTVILSPEQKEMSLI
jgi:hypothetical protein